MYLHGAGSRACLEPDAGEILAEEAETFPEEKDGDEREHHDRDERVAPEKKLNAAIGGDALFAGAMFRGEAFREFDRGVHARANDAVDPVTATNALV